MLQKSIKNNYLYNLSRHLLGFIIGILTMPYVNRVLGVNGIGKIEYANSIVMYFVLFSALGIPMYGIREVSKKRDDLKGKSKLVIELLVILIITTLISYLILFTIIFSFKSFEDLKPLLYIMSSMLIFSNLGVEWYYQGVEDQKFITIRFTIIKIITLLLLFIFVKGPNDYLKYGFILVISSVGGNIFNIINLKNHISLKDLSFKDLEFKKHLKPITTIFIASVSVSIYLQLDNLMLGILKGSTEVGYYSMANKLIRFAILAITTLGSVLMPRLSFLINHDEIQYQQYLKKTLNYFMIIALPISLIFVLLAKDFTLLIGGENFIPAVLTMQILSPLIIIVSIAYFIGFLILYPRGKESIYTIAVTLSALTSLIANFYFIPTYGHRGAALVTVLAELIGILIMILIYFKEIKKIGLININLFYYIIASIIMTLIIIYITNFNLNPFINILVSSIIGGIIYLVSLFYLKEEIIISIIKKVKSKLHFKGIIRE